MRLLLATCCALRPSAQSVIGISDHVHHFHRSECEHPCKVLMVVKALSTTWRESLLMMSHCSTVLSLASVDIQMRTMLYGYPQVLLAVELYKQEDILLLLMQLSQCPIVSGFMSQPETVLFHRTHSFQKRGSLFLG